MTSKTNLASACAAFALVLAADTQAQSRYATEVVSFNQGTGDGIFDQNLILGGPRGGDGIHVLTLGTGGNVTLRFDRVITDGPGADFTIFENGFEFNNEVFPEVAMVEVSTNGMDFARFPMRYDGRQEPLGQFGLIEWGSYSGLAGHIPPLANVDSNSLDPFDPAVSGGEAFDLSDLADDPLVLSGLVDLANINYVRIEDLMAGTVLDWRLVPIWDAGGFDDMAGVDTGATDIDSVAILNDTTSVLPTGPTTDFWRDDLGYIWLEISDPDGFADINLPATRLSANNTGVPFYRLRNFFVLQSADANGILLRSPLPVILEDYHAVLSLTVEDMSGTTSSDQIALNR